MSKPSDARPIHISLPLPLPASCDQNLGFITGSVAKEPGMEKLKRQETGVRILL
jgi:hypothetical protein